MHSARYIDYEGLKILSGFDERQVDPEATRARVNEIMFSSDEHKRFEAMSKALGDTEDFAEYKRMSKELEAISAECAAKYRDTWAENLVYFQLRHNEIPITHQEKTELLSKIKTLKNKQLITTKGVIVEV